ncbi:MAG: 3-methyl-2-oxobutanoate hydroxymethyltransferase [Candidatus Firestonebacteria bacterium]|nr:3-methyl-2-oxobutanoate hydroxymethyltransferase [Candidatus Firestonebacteria bacterium]
MKNKVTINTLLKKKKEKKKITMLTAYDFPMSVILNEIGIDIILVGDSLGMVVLGYENTLPVTVENILYHTKAVARGNINAFLVADMPFLSYKISIEEAVRNAGEMIKTGGAHGVKIEGGEEVCDIVKAIISADIPVMGHIGVTPQAVYQTGGYSLKGKDTQEAKKLINDARELEKAGVFAIVLEKIPKETAREITESVEIPTIGIGAGADCDGQVLVTHDLLGMFDKFTPKFSKKYIDLRSIIKVAFEEYKKDVEEQNFPGKEHTYSIDD